MPISLTSSKAGETASRHAPHRLRIAVVANGLPTGSETFIADHVRRIAEAGHEIELFITEPETGKRHCKSFNGARLRWAPRNRSIPLRTAALLRYIDSVRLIRMAIADRRSLSWRLLSTLSRPAAYDVIHCHYADNGIKSLLLRELGVLRGPIVTTLHGYDVSRLLNGSNRRGVQRLIAKGDRLLPVSRYWADRLIAIGAPSERVIVHRMGIDPVLYAPASGEYKRRTIRLLSVGRLVEKKGFEFAIRAVAALGRRWPLEYRIIGDGPLYKRLHALSHELGVTDKVRLLGWREPDAVRVELAEADLFLAPSVTAADGDQEGIPVSVMEAMAMGKPVVSSNHSGIPELVEHRKSGLLVNERDVGALAESVALLCEKPLLRRELGKRGRERVTTDFNAVSLNQSLLELYRTMAAEHSSPIGNGYGNSDG